MRPPRASAEPRLPPHLWRTGVAAGLASFLDAAMLISVSVSLVIWRDHYQLGASQIGLLTAALAFSVAVGALVGGWLGDQLGRERVFRYDLLVFLAGVLLILAASDGDVLVVGVAIVGLAAGADIPISLAVISDSAPERARGRLVAVTQSLWIAGILATFLLGFALAGSGFQGTQVLFGSLAVLTLVTVLWRLRISTSLQPAPTIAWTPTATLTSLIRPNSVTPLLATGTFYVFWNIASTTLGTYGTYSLITVTGLSQSQATGIVLVTFTPALLISFLFVRLADTVWRDRLFVAAALLQVAAFTIGAVSGGVTLTGMLTMVGLYSLSNVFAGEAIYKVWSQLLLPSDVRSTSMGLTYAVARGAAAAFLFLVPTVITHDPAILLWILAGLVAVSGSVGLLLIRRLAP